MSLGNIVMLLIIAWLGYMIVSYFLNHFPGSTARATSPPPRPEAPRRVEPDDIAHTWYRTLDVAESATLDEVSLAYRKKITQYHPDKVASLGPELRELAESKSKQLNEAYAYAKQRR